MSTQPFSTLLAHHHKITTTEPSMMTTQFYGAVGLSCHRDTKFLSQEPLDIVTFSNPLDANMDLSTWQLCPLDVMNQTGNLDMET